MAMSFGEEGVDRYIVVYKREFPPSEDEVDARREGVEWNDAKALEYKENVSLWRKRTVDPCDMNLDMFLASSAKNENESKLIRPSYRQSLSHRLTTKTSTCT